MILIVSEPLESYSNWCKAKGHSVVLMMAMDVWCHSKMGQNLETDVFKSKTTRFFIPLRIPAHTEVLKLSKKLGNSDKKIEKRAGKVCAHKVIEVVKEDYLGRISCSGASSFLKYSR